MDSVDVPPRLRLGSRARRRAPLVHHRLVHLANLHRRYVLLLQVRHTARPSDTPRTRVFLLTTTTGFDLKSTRAVTVRVVCDESDLCP